MNARRASAKRVAAVAGNLAFIREERAQLRTLLLRAAREGMLPYLNGALLEDFVENVDDAASPTELDELDEREYTT